MYNQKKVIMAIKTLISALISPHNASVRWWLSGSTPYNGGRGEPVLSKQLGAGIVRESLISICVKQKTDYKMLWQMKLWPRQILVLLECHKARVTCVIIKHPALYIYFAGLVSVDLVLFLRQQCYCYSPLCFVQFPFILYYYSKFGQLAVDFNFFTVFYSFSS